MREWSRYSTIRTVIQAHGVTRHTPNGKIKYVKVPSNVRILFLSRVGNTCFTTKSSRFAFKTSPQKLENLARIYSLQNSIILKPGDSYADIELGAQNRNNGLENALREYSPPKYNLHYTGRRPIHEIRNGVMLSDLIKAPKNTTLIREYVVIACRHLNTKYNKNREINIAFNAQRKEDGKVIKPVSYMQSFDSNINTRGVFANQKFISGQKLNRDITKITKDMRMLSMS